MFHCAIVKNAILWQEMRTCPEKGVVSALGQAGSCYNKYKEKTGVKRQWKKTEFVL